MRTIIIIFVLLMTTTFAAALTNSNSDIDIVIRTLIPSVLGYFLAGETTHDPTKTKIVQITAVFSLVMLVVLRWGNVGANGNIYTIRDVLMLSVGHLLGKNIEIKKPPD